MIRVDSPHTLAAALEALRDATPRTRVLAGGTDLMVEVQTGRTRPDRVVNVWGVAELRGTTDEDGGVRLRALTTCADLVRSPLVRARVSILAEAAWTVGAAQIRNRATLGGNLGTASPAADLNPVLVALGAVVRVCSRRGGARDVAVEDFLCGYRQTLRADDELIESVFVPPRPAGERVAFRKVGTRRAQAIAKVVVALAAAADGGTVRVLRAAAGSVAPRTVLLATLGRDLAGTAPDAAAIDAAARRAAHSVTPIDDVRSTAAYRREVLFRTLRTALHDTLADTLSA